MVTYLHKETRLKCFELTKDVFRTPCLQGVLEAIFSEFNDEILDLVEDAKNNKRQYLSQPRKGIIPEFSVKCNDLQLMHIAELSGPYLSLPVDFNSDWKGDGSTADCRVSLSHAEVTNEGRLFSEYPEIHVKAVLCVRIESVERDVGEDVETTSFV